MAGSPESVTQQRESQMQEELSRTQMQLREALALIQQHQFIVPPASTRSQAPTHQPVPTSISDLHTVNENHVSDWDEEMISEAETEFLEIASDAENTYLSIPVPETY